MTELLKAAAYVGLLSLLGAFVLRWALARDLRRQLGTPIIVLAALVPVISFLSPHFVVFNLLAFLIVPVLARTRALIAPIYLCAYVLLPFVDLGITVGGVYLVTYGVGTSLGLGAILTLLVREQGPARSKLSADLPALAIFLLLVVGHARDSSATNMLRVLLDQALTIGLPYFVVSRAVRSWADARLALVGLVAATVMLSVVILYEAWRAWPIYRIVWDHYGVELGGGASVKLRGGLLRAPGPFPEPTSLAFVLCIGTLVLIAVRDLFRSGFHRWLIIGIALVGILAPQSRGAWIGLVVGAVAIEVSRRNWAAIGRGFVVIAGSALLVLAGAAVSPRIADLAGLSTVGQQSGDYREDLFARGLEEIRERPLFGASLDTVVGQMRDMVQGEGIIDFVNTYIYIALITGLAGLAVLVMALGAQLAFGWRLMGRLRASVLERQLAGFVFSALVSMIVMLAFTALTGRNTGLLVATMALMAALGTAGRRSARKIAPPPRAATTAAISNAAALR